MAQEFEAGRRFERRDYYRVLQVDPAAHPEVVRAAYRTLLRVLGKHPDLGGPDAEARSIIEAYETLSKPERRHAYDAWLNAHSAPSPPPRAPSAPSPSPPAQPARAPAGLPPDVDTWVRGALPDFHEAPDAPFAARFDLVLEGPPPTSDRLYVKAVPLLAPEQWPTVFTLCRAVAVARGGLLPSTDVVLFAADRVRDLGTFLEESLHHSAQWSWNRCLIAVCLRHPVRLHTGKIRLVPGILRRLSSEGASTAPSEPSPRA
jgi:hypothetical protein